MEITITGLWISYVVTFIIFYLLTWLVCNNYSKRFPTFSHGIMAFVASIFSALSIIIITTVYPLSITDSTSSNWFNILLLVSIFLPILLFFYVLWAGEHKCFFGPKVISSYICDETKCVEDMRIIKEDQNIYTFKYNN